MIRRGVKVPRFIKKIRLFFFHLWNLSLKPQYLRFYQEKIAKLSPDVQLFFVGRNDFGTQLYLLNYVKVWEETRGPTAIVILTGSFLRVRDLASMITPNTILIYPDRSSLLFPIALFGSKMIHGFIFDQIYPYLANIRPDGLNLFYLNGSGVTEYNSFLDRNYIQNASQHTPQFLNAYKSVRKQFDYRWHLFEDFYEMYGAQERRHWRIESNIKELLGISKPYVLLNINCKDYLGKRSNRRSIHFPERYNAVINLLIQKGYDVVLQGREEQPLFAPRLGFVDYSRGQHVSIQNDLFLYSNCEFVISSKSGIEIFASICNAPVLGLNYTELLGMQPAQKMRFYPKYIRNRTTGHILSWVEHITSPSFFEIGENDYTNDSYEYIDLSEEDMVGALEEFLLLLPRPERDWTNYTPLQKEFKKTLTPLHLELFLVKGVPSDYYLKKTEAKKAQFEELLARS